MGTIIELLILPFFFLAYFFAVTVKYLDKILHKGENSKPRLVWGPVPLINNKYWSESMKSAGYESVTLMNEYYSSIHKKSDFDLYTYELPGAGFLKKPSFNFYYKYLMPYHSFLYAILKYDIFHHHFHGGFLGGTIIWRFEATLLRQAKCKTVLTTYGADAYMYSKVMDVTLRQVLLISYPLLAKKEEEIEQRINYWTKEADIIMNGFMLDGFGRWDVTIGNFLSIDTVKWNPKKIYSNKNGLNGIVKIIHTPNHRGGKGTEFILKAIDELKKEGLKIEMILLEKTNNETVRKKMYEADILIDQIIFGYGLSAIEGMATGLPVLSSINETYAVIFRRYSFLNECPILSSSPETIKEDLRVLIKNPKIRNQLGVAGRKFVEKYHSEKAAKYVFEKIYGNLWYNKKEDLMNMFHPLKSAYNASSPYIDHPLVKNKLPVLNR